MTRALVLTAALAVASVLAACDQRQMLIVATDAGTEDAGATTPDADVDAGVPVEPIGGSECDQQDDCLACASCAQAPRQVCNEQALACDASPDCVALVQCVNACGTDACSRACATAHPSAVAIVRAFFVCAYCTGCTADCRAEHVVWCETPLF